MKFKSVTVDGKKKIILTPKASGESKVKEALLVVMGQGWEYKEPTNK